MSYKVKRFSYLQSSAKGAAILGTLGVAYGINKMTKNRNIRVNESRRNK